MNFKDYLKEEMEKAISDIKDVVIERNPDFQYIAKNEIDYIQLGYQLKSKYPNIRQAIEKYNQCMQLQMQHELKKK